MSSVAEVVAQLNVVRVGIEEQRQLALVLTDQLDQLAQRLTRTIGSSTNADARATVAHTVVAVQRTREGAQCAAEAAAALAAYIATITGAMSTGGEARPPAEAIVVQTRPQRSAVEEIRPLVGRDIAAGRLYDVNGRPLTPLVGPGDTGAGDGLAEPLPSLRFITHIEANATAYMRRHRVRQAVLYTNMRPCLGEDGCTQNIKATLPPGCRLTVYQVRRNGGVRVWQFDGGGEGVVDDRG